MPRNSGTGVWSPPPNINAVSGAPIESADWNALVGDLTSTLNVAWPVGLGGTGVSSLGGFLTVLGGLPLAGGTMTGPLTLSGDATAALQPISKQQFDTGLAAKAAASHTQAASTITDFSTAADARIAAASINALADVTVTSPVVNDALRWSGTAWVNSGAGYTEYNKGVFVPSTKVTQVHGLASTPSLFEAYIKCRVADQEYAVGDYVSLTHALGSISLYYPLWMNATEVGFSPRVGQGIGATQKTSLVDGSFVNSRWDLIFRVFP